MTSVPSGIVCSLCLKIYLQGHYSNMSKYKQISIGAIFCFNLNIPWNSELKPYAKFQNPRPTPSERKVTGGERDREENAVNSGLYGQHT